VNRRTALAVGVLGLTLGGAVVLHKSRAAGHSEVAPPSKGTPRLRLEPGTKYIYALSARAETSFPFGTRAMAAEMLLDAELAVRVVGRHEGVYDVVIGLASLPVYDVRAEEASLLTPESLEQDRHALLTQEVLARIDDRGGIRSISFRRSTPARARKVLERLVEALALTFPEQPAVQWRAVEPTPNGVAETSYTSEPGAPSKITRTRLRYVKVAGLHLDEDELSEHGQRVVGRAKIELDADGALLSSDETERLMVDMGEAPAFDAASKFSLSRKSRSTFDPRTVDVAALDQDVSNAEHVVDARERDEGRSASVTTSAIAASVFTASAGGRIPRVFPGRVGAYLRLHPDEIPRLVGTFRGPNVTPAGRAYIMDLLSITGDATAQAAMRSALTEELEKADPHAFGQYLQRFVFVGTPEPESAEFLVKTMDRAKASGDEITDGSALVALGAVVRALSDTGEDGPAERFDARLRSELQSATGARRVYALRGLGNSAMPNDEPAILALAGDTASAVRDQVAQSLRHFDDAASRAALLSLTCDQDPDAATTAFKALSEGHMPEAEWRDLAARVAAQKTNPRADSALVSLIREHADEAGSVGIDILKAVRARTSPGATDLIATIDGMLEGPETPVAAAAP
jgi:hypothetical protein